MCTHNATLVACYQVSPIKKGEGGKHTMCIVAVWAVCRIVFLLTLAGPFLSFAAQIVVEITPLPCKGSFFLALKIFILLSKSHHNC